MATRTTSNAVGEIIEVDSSISVTPFIEAASALVDDVCVNSGYAATKLELIERWLAAHFYAIRDPRAVQEQAGSVRATYQSKVDLGLNTTHYGQMAMQLDTAGNLSTHNASAVKGKRRAVGVTYLGTTTTEQERQYDRT